LSDRVFLDANVLVSAAWLRNVRTSDQRTRLHRLVQRVQIVDEPRAQRLPAAVRLPEKDIPILLAAIESGSDYLLTGDLEHFGRYFGQEVAGVNILRPRDYLLKRLVT
jgi:uncharacterized protein